jgi:hypothetical protein
MKKISLGRDWICEGGKVNDPMYSMNMNRIRKMDLSKKK